MQIIYKVLFFILDILFKIHKNIYFKEILEDSYIFIYTIFSPGGHLGLNGGGNTHVKLFIYIKSYHKGDTCW